MIQNFTITVMDNNGNENLPTRKISTKIGDNFVQVGSGWVKKDKNGNPFISCKLKDEYKKEDGTVYDGFVMLSVKEYRKLKLAEEKQSHLTSPTNEFPNGINMATHPLNSDMEQKTIDERFAAFETNNLEDIPF